MATHSIGTGKDYATLALWASYVNALGTLSANEIGEVYGIVSDVTTVTVAGWTPNGFTVTLRAAAGEGVSVGGRADYLSSGRASLENNIIYASGYNFTGSGLIVEDLQIRHTASTASAVFSIGPDVTISRVIVKQQSSANPAIISSGTGTGRVLKSSLILVGSASGTAVAPNDALNAYRVTVIGNGGGNGFKSGTYTSLKCIGCVAYNFGTNYADTAISGSTNNATSAGTFSGTGWNTSGQVSVASTDFVSTAGGSEDYSAAAASTKLVSTGVAISGVTVDLFNNAIPQGPTEDIGATEALSSGYTITSDQGSYTLSGQTASLFAARNITADQGSYTLTGQDATLTYAQPGNTTIVCESGTYTITGTAALIDLAMNADFGTYSLSGQDVSFILTTPQAYTITADQGTYSLVGQSARLSWSNEVITTNGNYTIAMSMRIGI